MRWWVPTSATICHLLKFMLAFFFLRSWGLFRQKVVKDKRSANIRLQSIKGRLGSLRDAELFPLPFGELFPLLPSMFAPWGTFSFGFNQTGYVCRVINVLIVLPSINNNYRVDVGNELVTDDVSLFLVFVLLSFFLVIMLLSLVLNSN